MLKFLRKLVQIQKLQSQLDVLLLADAGSQASSSTVQTTAESAATAATEPWEKPKKGKKKQVISVEPPLETCFGKQLTLIPSKDFRHLSNEEDCSDAWPSLKRKK